MATKWPTNSLEPAIIEYLLRSIDHLSLHASSTQDQSMMILTVVFLITRGGECRNGNGKQDRQRGYSDAYYSCLLLSCLYLYLILRDDWHWYLDNGRTASDTGKSSLHEKMRNLEYNLCRTQLPCDPFAVALLVGTILVNRYGSTALGQTLLSRRRRRWAVSLDNEQIIIGLPWNWWWFCGSLGSLSLHGRYAILGGPRQRRPGHSHRREIYAHRSSIQLICRHCRFPLIETFLWRVIVAGMFAIDRGSDREREEMRW